jgi:D-glycero-alpha-D-manno-heptose-7-phosphate kinase
MIVSRTPFRLPLGGGGTDLPAYYTEHEGFLITAAVNKYMFININQPAIVRKIKVNYSQTEVVELDDIDSIKHDIVRETLKYLNLRIPLEITSMADLSAGTGMGSSSSYTVGLLRCLNTIKRKYMSQQDLAEEACLVEIQKIGKPIGKQDQYATAFGGIIQMEIDKQGVVKVTPLPIDHETVCDLEHRLMMFYTSIERDANVILGEQSKAISAGAANVTNAAAESSKPISATEAMHLIKNIGYRVKDALIEGDIDKFGSLLHEHWETKKRVSSKMSNGDIDAWYNLARENGALGGKIMGAGGGGFFVFCVENGRRRHLRKTLENAGLNYMDFRFDWEGCKIVANL